MSRNTSIHSFLYVVILLAFSVINIFSEEKPVKLVTVMPDKSLKVSQTDSPVKIKYISFVDGVSDKILYKFLSDNKVTSRELYLSDQTGNGEAVIRIDDPKGASIQELLVSNSLAVYNGKAMGALGEILSDCTEYAKSHPKKWSDK